MSATDTINFTKNILDVFNLYNVVIFILIFISIILIFKNL